jgi:hypothetical protein
VTVTPQTPGNRVGQVGFVFNDEEAQFSPKL